MGREFLKIDSASNTDGNALFVAICKDVLGEPHHKVKGDLGLHVAKTVTTKDLITLLQEKNIPCEIKVYLPEQKVPNKVEEKEPEKEDDPFN